MTITPGHFMLSPQQRRFREMISAYPALLQFWNFENKSVDLATAENALHYLCSGESHLLRFFVSVWLGENKLELDFTDAVKALDEPELKVTRDWLADPFWP